MNAASRYACIISGIPGHDIQDLRIRNVDLRFPGGGTEKQAATRPAEKEKTYPEPTMFGMMPAWGFFIRHVDGMELSDIDLFCAKKDARPPFFLEEVSRLDLDHVRTNAAEGSTIFSLHKVRDFTAEGMAGVADVHRDQVGEEQITPASFKPQP